MQQEKQPAKVKVGNWVINYEIKFGQGQLGSVYFEEKIKNEVIEMKKVKHPNLVQIIDGKLVSGNKLFLFMEKCGKQNLAQILEEKGPFTEKEAQVIFKNIVNGYGELYKNNILHRDIKLENILKQDENYKLADFGLVKILNLQDQKQITIYGTPMYQPPEFLVNEKYVDLEEPYKIDIWAIGVVLYKLIEKKFPWDYGDSQDTFLDNIQHIPIQYEKNVSEDCKDIIQRILQYDPKDRISFSEILQHKFYLQA
ncbi:Protein kinase-like domain [Pseudocohnilembus persalinus]|uniref:Protein kinase-like domain n=1 Tax=Pseudocohnilembus persalinus TaxID=266149 RepID=A0A0V0Q8T1_PSEPJ|nr:Protein kinase-like domain [Pseudocohnilembus persalinus]|eukprot:KRW98664.1 Protein kinase-like domain [Pseudocohnilembus persalinus]